jgi:hypothetical protein
MKITTTTARRQLVEGILAPQLHTLYHNRTGKLLRLVAIPGSARGDYLRQCYAEAMLDLLDQNNLLVVRKPDQARQYAEGEELVVDLEAGDLDPAATPPPTEIRQHQREYKRMMPGDTLADVWPQPGDHDTPVDLSEHAPSLVADKMADETAGAHISRTVAGITPSDDARAAFERLGARMKAREFIGRMMAPLLQRMGCIVTVMDNADADPDGNPTKVTVFVDLPTGATK